MCLSLSIQVLDLGPISHLEAKAPPEWSTLAFWYPVSLSQWVGPWGKEGDLENG